MPVSRAVQTGRARVTLGPMAGLVRPQDDRKIAGVCAGLARRFGMSPNVMRLLFVLSIFLPGPQVILYAALWILMPSE
jgi:phage shock protein PspC (stress-responsive transcriptional regulator)